MNDIYLRSSMLLGEDMQTGLQDKHILILGLGGVGSYVCEALARSGINNFTICDNDIVSPSNLNRQLCALNSTIGLNKCDVVARRILDINKNANVNTLAIFYSEETSHIFWEQQYDFIVDAIDSVTSKKHLIKSAIELNIPIISALGTGNKLDPTKFTITDIYKTSICPLARVMRRELKEMEIKKHTVLFSTEMPIKPIPLDAPAPGKNTVPGSVPWVPSCAGLMIAGHVVLELLDKSSY